MPPQSVTLAEIATKVGVSKNTVSLALRNAPKISLATRKRIQKTATSLGYQPNPRINEAMRFVRSHRISVLRDTLGVLLGWPVKRPSELTYNHHLALIFSSIEKRALELGYNVDYIPIFGPGMTPKRLKGILDSRNIRGLIVPPTGARWGRLRLDLADYACVQIGHSLWAPRIHTVATNETDVITLASKMLWRKGYRRIGFYFSRWSVAQSWNRLKIGVLHSQSLFSNVASPIPLHINEQQTEIGHFHDHGRLRSDFIPWFKKHKPQVIVGVVVAMLRQVLQDDLGLQVPRDVGLVQFDFTPKPNLDVAGVDHQKEVQAAIAVDYVSGLLYLNNLGLPAQPVEINVRSKWHEGPTLLSLVK
jgi:LacI family transcriptional regulator